MSFLLSIFSLIIGLCCGSFATCIGSRIFSEDENFRVFGKKSKCIHCKIDLGVKNLIPIFSWIFQKGKCHNCNAKIPTLYPITEILTAILSCILYNVFNFELATFFLVLATIMMIQVVSDLRYGLLSDFCTFLIGIMGIFFAYISNRNFTDISKSYFFIFLVIGISVLIVFLLKREEPIGFGDVKVFIFMPLFFNYFYILIFLFSCGISVVLFNLAFKNKYLPFMPYMVLSFWLTLLIDFLIISHA